MGGCASLWELSSFTASSYRLISARSDSWRVLEYPVQVGTVSTKYRGVSRPQAAFVRFADSEVEADKQHAGRAHDRSTARI